MQVIEVVPVLDTNIYADNDVLFVPIAVPQFGHPGKVRKLVSIAVLDKSDQAQDMDLVFSQGTITLGTINGVVGVSDADADNILGVVSVAVAEYSDLVNSQLATKNGLGLVMQPDAVLYLSGVVRSGTPTYAADGLTIKLGFEDMGD